jgi:hypothetical protein
MNATGRNQIRKSPKSALIWGMAVNVTNSEIEDASQSLTLYALNNSFTSYWVILENLDILCLNSPTFFLIGSAASLDPGTCFSVSWSFYTR